jgi:hypothetical protein
LPEVNDPSHGKFCCITNKAFLWCLTTSSASANWADAGIAKTKAALANKKETAFFRRYPKK